MSFNEDAFFVTIDKIKATGQIEPQVAIDLIKQWFDAPKSYWDELELRNVYAMRVVPISEHQDIWGDLAEVLELKESYQQHGDRALEIEGVEDMFYMIDALEYICHFLSTLREVDSHKGAGSKIEGKKDGKKDDKDGKKVEKKDENKDEKKGEKQDKKKDEKNDGFGGGSGGISGLRGFGTDAMGGRNARNDGWQGRMW